MQIPTASTHDDHAQLSNQTKNRSWRRIEPRIVAAAPAGPCLLCVAPGRGRRMIWAGFGMGAQLRTLLADRARDHARVEQKWPNEGAFFRPPSTGRLARIRNLLLGRSTDRSGAKTD